jgi:hypothetical protein
VSPLLVWRARLPLPLASLTTIPHRAVSLSVTRCGLAAGLVHFYLSNYQDRRFLWGPHGVLAQAPWTGHGSLITSVSPYRFWPSEVGFEVLFHLSLLLALAFGLFGGRLLTAANWLMLSGLHGQNPLLLDGGDNLARLLLLFMTLTDNNLYLAVGAVRRRNRLRHRLGYHPGSTRFFIHNCGVLLVAFQVVILYGAAILWKLSGEPWRDGTALYYVFRVTEFTYRPLPSLVVENPVLVTILTYGVIVSQMALVWFAVRRRRPFVVLGAAMVLHAGIAVSMGLVTFSVVILSGVAVLVDDAAWIAVLAVAARFFCSPHAQGSPTTLHPCPVRPVAAAPFRDLRSHPGNRQMGPPVRWSRDESPLAQRGP